MPVIELSKSADGGYWRGMCRWHLYGEDGKSGAWVLEAVEVGRVLKSV